MLPGEMSHQHVAEAAAPPCRAHAQLLLVAIMLTSSFHFQKKKKRKKTKTTAGTDLQGPITPPQTTRLKKKKSYQSLELQFLVPCPLALLPLQSPCPSPADPKTMATTAAPSHAHPSPGHCQRELPVPQLAWGSCFLFTQQWIVPEAFVSPEVASSVG